jgi:asparagine synthase (glutamine-hydrolysing)
MCGLTAFLALRGQTVPGHNGQFPADEAEDALKASMKIVKHRGPDAEGYWINPDSEVGKRIFFCDAIYFSLIFKRYCCF